MAQLQGADLRGADLRGANLTGADLPLQLRQGLYHITGDQTEQLIKIFTENNFDLGDPISLELIINFSEPYIVVEHLTNRTFVAYQFSSINEWLQTSNNSPINRQKYSIYDVHEGLKDGNLLTVEQFLKLNLEEIS